MLTDATPTSDLERLVHESHIRLAHPGKTKLYETLQKMIDLPGLKATSEKFTHNFQVCQRPKTPESVTEL